MKRSFGCVIPCIANKDTESKHVRLLFFLSFLLSCLLACKPPPPTTIITLDDVSSQQKRDVQHQIPKPGARVYLFCSVLLLLFFP